MSKNIIPDAALQQHIAVLGKTGSGKTSTAKLLVEQVVDGGARVCILDTVKSDWWGLTSSADGKKPGLPFHILGGPRGHVPLHASAGKAIAEIVASGALRHSIIDMADFEAGGAQRFFVDFAPALLRHMRGVLYLVIEEAHELAPKERAGFGAENMSIHWAKKLATAGRSKGVRLVVLTQRTQSLHNALLGSCDTLIAHRFTAPADQDPVVKWLKSNLEPELAREVASSLSSLKTGEGWLCAGEARIFERRQFPRIRTYDNSATPTGDDHHPDVKTAPVDQDKLRTIIGEAVKEAEANDPKLLRAEIAKLKTIIDKKLAENRLVVDQVSIAAARQEGREEGARDGYAAGLRAVQPIADRLGTLSTAVTETIEGFQQDLRRLLAKAPAANRRKNIPENIRPARDLSGQAPRPQAAPQRASAGPGEALPRVERAFLTTLAQQARALTRNQVAIFAGYSAKSRHVDNTLASLRTSGFVEGGGEAIRITDAGISALGAYQPLPTGAALRAYWQSELDRAASAFLGVICDAYPGTLTREEVAEKANYSPTSRHVDNTLAQLRTRDLVTGSGKAIRASEDLFS